MAAIRALQGEDVSWLPGAVAGALVGDRLPVSAHDGFLAAVDESVRAFVLEGDGLAAERAGAAAAALRELGCDVSLVPTRHPVVDIVRFQLLTVELAAARGARPDLIRRDDERWARAAAAHESPYS